MPRRIASATATAVATLLVLLAVAYIALAHLGFRAQPVLSGSMEPALPVGSLAVVRPVDGDDVRRGDVVTFGHPKLPGALVTHRVVGVTRRGGELLLRTKGDANARRDSWVVRSRSDLAREVLDVPLLGYPLTWASGSGARRVAFAIFCLALLGLLLAEIWRPRAAAEVTPA
jgi:signal peptidase